MRRKDKRIAHLWNWLVQYRGRLILSIGLSIVEVYAVTQIPLVIGQIVDTVSQLSTLRFEDVLILLGQLLLWAVVVAGVQWTNALNYQSIIYRLVAMLRHLMQAKMQKLSIRTIDSVDMGDVESSVINDTEQLSESLLVLLNQAVIGGLTIVAIVWRMMEIDRHMLLVIVLLTPLSLMIARLIASKSYYYFTEQTRLRGIQTMVMDDMTSQVDTFQLMDASEWNYRRFEKVNIDYQRKTTRAVFFSSLVNPMTRFVNALIYIVVCTLGLYLMSENELTVGLLTVCLSYATQYAKPFNDLSTVLAEWQGALACCERIGNVLDLEEEVESERNVQLVIQDGSITFHNVAFRYEEDRPFIENCNLQIEAGQHVAIVGSTGSGKTTLIKLLLQLYPLNGGSIMIDDVDLAMVNRELLYQQIGVVMQDVWFSVGTVYDNIAYGRPDATLEEVQHVAKEVYAHYFIEQLPKGYDTPMQEALKILSQGQQQLISIARVLLVNPRMIILDEATASLDFYTEQLIQSALNVVMTNRTSITIAHRLTTIQSSDLIIVMQDGKIVEQGTHDVLFEKKGYYWAMQNVTI